MNFKEICDLIELVAGKGIPLVEVEHAGVKVKIQGMQVQTSASGAELFPASLPSSAEAAPVSEDLADNNLQMVLSPMVGTFYRAPRPDADPFVEMGAPVDKGTVLCIIEAMKLMNEIESDFKGEVVKIFPDNGESVEFGQKLFAIRTG